jgi:hypothetical protein
VEGETYILISLGRCIDTTYDDGNFLTCQKGGVSPIPGIKTLIKPPEAWGSIGKEDIVTR